MVLCPQVWSCESLFTLACTTRAASEINKLWWTARTVWRSGHVSLCSDKGLDDSSTSSLLCARDPVLCLHNIDRLLPIALDQGSQDKRSGFGPSCLCVLWQLEEEMEWDEEQISVLEDQYKSQCQWGRPIISMQVFFQSVVWTTYWTCSSYHLFNSCHLSTCMRMSQEVLQLPRTSTALKQSVLGPWRIVTKCSMFPIILVSLLWVSLSTQTLWSLPKMHANF